MAVRQGDRQAPLVHRELRQHERALLRQDRHADRGRRATSTRRWTWRARRARRCCSTPTSTPSSRRASSTRSTRRSAPTGAFDLAGYRKLDEVPYDFIRKRLSVLVADKDRHVHDHQGRAGRTCWRSARRAETADGADRADRRGPRPDRPALRGALSGQGFRTLGVAYRDVGSDVAHHQGPRVGHDVPGPPGPLRPAEGRGSRDTIERPRSASASR